MTSQPRILYLVPDLSDAAVRKRVEMLQDGGAAVSVMGFRRNTTPYTEMAGASVIDLGQTFNGGFIQRILAVIKVVMTVRQWQAAFTQTDAVVARNLEMLAIAVRGRATCASRGPLVYECLDIHRLLLNHGPVGKILRGLEGWLSRRASALITSSPAFVEHYYQPISQVRLPVRLLENRLYIPHGMPLPPISAQPRPAGPPWRIGWYGAIRCRKSLAMLLEVANRMQGQVEIIIRGKPAYDQFEDFERDTKACPWLTFGGPYTYPQDLAQLYQGVHFTWAVDMYEEGQNSTWLLPNRIYEGGYYASVPLARADVQIGHTITQLGIGITFNPLSADELCRFFTGLTSLHYQSLEQKAKSLPVSGWIYMQQDCVELVNFITTLTPPASAS